MAAEKCRSVGGYLATPRDPEELSFVLTAVRSIPSLANLTSYWRLGVVDNMQGHGHTGFCQGGYEVTTVRLCQCDDVS